jgi:hypothetical protein
MKKMWNVAASEPSPAERERVASEAKPGEGKAVKLVPVAL